MNDMTNMKYYKFGFSLGGVLAVVFVMLPNLLYLFCTPPNDVLSGNEAAYWLWNALETVGRFGLMITLCTVVNQSARTVNRAVTIFALFSLLAYYVLWILYFVGAFHGLSLVGLAVFPSMFFLLIAWRERNIFALVFSTLFAAVHIAITSSNFLFRSIG